MVRHAGFQKKRRGERVVCGVSPLAGGDMRSVHCLAVAVYPHSCQAI